MVDTAERVIAELRETVISLEKDVEELSNFESTNGHFEKKAQVVSELITQALMKVDSVQVSKDAAANALREGDRRTSRQLAVLLARRKTIVKKLNELGDAVDKLNNDSNARSERAERSDMSKGNDGSTSDPSGKDDRQ